MEQSKLQSAIDYFRGQAEISDFAAEVEGYLRELYAIKFGEKKPLKVYKFVGDDDIQCGDGLAIVAAENDSQACRLMDDAAKGDITDADGYNIQYLVSTLDTINPIEIQCLSASLSEPTIIAIRAYEE